MAAPGLGIVFTQKASVPALEAAGQPRGYYLDVVAEYKKQAHEAQTRFAQPVALHAALHAACTSPRRHRASRRTTSASSARCSRSSTHLATLGIEPLLDDAYRSNIAVNFRLPVGMPTRSFSKQDGGARATSASTASRATRRHFQLSTIGDLTDAHIEGMTGRSVGCVEALTP